MHTPGFEFALAHHRADLRRHADDHRTALRRAGRLARSRFPGLRALVTVAGRHATTTAPATTAPATMAPGTMAPGTMTEAQPCPP